MHVENFMTKNPVACDASSSVAECAKLMRDKGVGSVVVLRNRKVAGIVTDREIATRVVAEGLPPTDVAVQEIMTENPARLTLDDNIFSVVDTMRSANVARRVPVVNHEDELIGIVSISDVATVAKDLIDAVMLEETHHALEEAKVLTGAKRIVDDIRRPSKLDRLNREQETHAVRGQTPGGLPGESGGAGRPASAGGNP